MGRSHLPKYMKKRSLAIPNLLKSSMMGDLQPFQWCDWRVVMGTSHYVDYQEPSSKATLGSNVKHMQPPYWC